MSQRTFSSRRKQSQIDESLVSLTSSKTSMKHNTSMTQKSGISKRSTRKSRVSHGAFSSSYQKSSSNATGAHNLSQNASILVVDPLDQTIRNPVSLNKIVNGKEHHRHGHDDTQLTVNTSMTRHNEKSMGSMNSGRVSPTMSEVSEAISVSFSSSFRVDSSIMGGNSMAQMMAQNEARGRAMSARTGVSSPSTYMSEEEFLFQSPAVGFQDDTSMSIGETQSVVGEAKDLRDEYAESIDGRSGMLHDDEYATSRSTNDLTPQQVEQLMNQDFVINLTETPTIFYFETIDASVPNDATYLDQVVTRNKAYAALKDQKLQNKDNYNERDMQTISMFSKNKYSDIPRQEVQEQSVSVAAWEIYDEYETLRELEEKEREEQEQLTVKQDDEEDDDDDDDEDDAGAVASTDEHGSVRSMGSKLNDKSNVLKLPKFKQSLMIMERLIIQNSMIQKQEEYKQFADHPDDEIMSRTTKAANALSSTKPGDLKLLWKYTCDLTKGQNVNCMCWNHKNEDMLAAGYGNIDFVGKKEGAICIWMLKNPTFPERYIPIENKGVSAIDFSRFNPSLLSVGYNDGTVAIFDIRRRDVTPVLETSKHHTGTVWDLQWVDRGKDLGERLHSVGVDGRVNCWSIKKGLECQQIMRLKRHGKGEGVLSRESGGMCIDFDPNDSNLYIVGTEDGTIYKCSCSYNEQYLQTFQGHTGPVYRIRWNPFDRDSFISCSADWTIRVWNAKRDRSSISVGGAADGMGMGMSGGGVNSSGTGDLKIEPYQNKEEKRSCVITDVQWSPYTQGVFASTSITGDVEVWDINYNSMKPRFAKSNPDVQYNCLLYANKSPALLVGDNQGNIEVLKPIGGF